MKEFDEVIGYENVKQELYRICDILNNTEKYKKLGVSSPQGIILYGEPGVGKTLMCNCFINSCKRNVFVCRKDKPSGEFIKEIKNTFDKAQANAPSIIFLDDLDKFANEDVNHKNAEEYVTVQSCIDNCKGKEVFVLATANQIGLLPLSLLRVGRFDKRIKIDNPRGNDAEAIIDHYLQQKNYVEELDIEQLARILDGKSCAELENVVNEAGIYAGYQNKAKIDMDDMLKACIRVIYNAPECCKEQNNEVLLQTAYHEAGHVVVSELLESNSVSFVSVKNHSGSIGGFTAYYQDEKFITHKTYMENRVKSLLAGKASTEVVYGDVDVGANVDLRRAFDIVGKFVDNFCSNAFDRFQLSSNDSDNLHMKKEMQISFEMERYYIEVRKMLIQNRKFLDEVAKALFDRKTLMNSDIQNIKGQVYNY